MLVTARPDGAPIKTLIGLLMALSFLLLFAGCASFKDNGEKRIVEIFSAVKIDKGYVYSDEALVEMDGIAYLLREKATYGEDGVIKRLLSYKPEGVIEYSKEEIQKDKNMIDYAGIPFEQKWLYRAGSLDVQDRSHIGVRKIQGNLLMHEVAGDRVLFYKIE